MNKSKSNRFSPEVRDRAVRMVLEHRGEHPSLWAAIESIAPKISCVPQTLHEWVRKHEIVTVCAMASPAKNAIASRLWSARSRKCARLMRF